MRPFEFLTRDHERAAVAAADRAFNRKDGHYQFAVLDNGELVASRYGADWKPITVSFTPDGAEHDFDH